MRKKFPYPKRYWANIAAMCAASALLFVDIFVSDRLTGDKEFCDYGPTDWRGFALFMVSLVALVLLVFCFAVRAGKYVRAREKEIAAYLSDRRYAGIAAGDYKHVWLDFDGKARARILEKDGAFCLWIDRFDEVSERWDEAAPMSVHASLMEVKEYLYFEWGFICDENARLEDAEHEGV